MIRTGDGIARGAGLLIAASVAWAWLLAAAPACRAVPIEDDEEVSVGDIAFTVPREIARARRNEASEDGFSLLTGLCAFGGVDGNVYRSPGGLTESSGSYGSWGLVRGEARFGTGRLLSSVSWKLFEYPDHQGVNSNRARLREWYRQGLGKRAWLEVAVDARRRNDDAATIEGEDYAEDYGHWKYGAESFLGALLARGHSLEAGVLWTRKNYDEVAGLTSLDWDEATARVRYRGRLGPERHLTLAVSSGIRKYDENPSTDLAGNEPAGNPLEEHRFDDASAGLELPLGARGDLGLEYSYAAKTDRFQDYESYTGHRVALTAESQAGRRWNLRGDAVWSRREYDHLRGDGVSPLHYSLLEVGGGARYRVEGPWWLFAHGSAYTRDSNRSTGSLYRDYSGIVLTAGISFFR